MFRIYGDVHYSLVLNPLVGFRCESGATYGEDELEPEQRDPTKPNQTKMETLAISDHKYNLRWPDYHDTILSTFR